MSDEADALNGITEADFHLWKHHPATKAFMRYLLDYEQQLAEEAVTFLRNTPVAPDPFKSGQFQGEVNAYRTIIELEFAKMVEFYPIAEEEEPE